MPIFLRNTKALSPTNLPRKKRSPASQRSRASANNTGGCCCYRQPLKTAFLLLSLVLFFRIETMDFVYTRGLRGTTSDDDSSTTWILSLSSSISLWWGTTMGGGSGILAEVGTTNVRLTERDYSPPPEQPPQQQQQQSGVSPTEAVAEIEPEVTADHAEPMTRSEVTTLGDTEAFATADATEVVSATIATETEDVAVVEELSEPAAEPEQEVTGHGDDSAVVPLDTSDESNATPHAEEFSNNADETVSTAFSSDTTTKPVFVFHFGPMKTGTTTLQRDLKWSLQEHLEKDGWHYLEGDDPLHMLDQEDDYFERFRRLADEYRAKNQSLIMSKEQNSVLYNFHPEMYQKLHETLKDDWDVEFVVAYRPYLEWLPSLWQEQHRAREGRGWKNGAGEWDVVNAFFPGYWGWHTTRGRTYTSHIVDNAAEFFKVKVFDMYDPQGSRTAFVCDMIGRDRVPSACEESLRLDQQSNEKPLNVGSIDDVHIDSVSVRLASQGKIDAEKYTRQEIIVAVKTHLAETLHQTPLDLPYNCPSDEEYESILTFTLEKENHLLPELAVSEGRHELLRGKLNKKIASKTYCEIDLDKLMEDDQWKEFFARFA